MALTLPIGVLPALNGALWPVTFIALQIIINVHFIHSGFWRILATAGNVDAIPAAHMLSP
jgi:hypothetical protein